MNLFTYGTLMDPCRFARVSGRARRRVPGRVTGFRIEPLTGTPYVVAEPDASEILDGVIYCKLDFTQLRRLDIYEGAAYQRVPAIAHAGRRRLNVQLYRRRRDYTYS